MPDEQRAADFRRMVVEYGDANEYDRQTQKELNALELARRVAAANPDELVRFQQAPWVTRYPESRSDTDGVVHIPLYHFNGYLLRFVPRDQTARIGADEFNELAFYTVTSLDFFQRESYLQWRETHPNSPSRKSGLKCHCGRSISAGSAEICPECKAAKCEAGHCLCGTLWDGTYRWTHRRNLFEA